MKHFLRRPWPWIILGVVIVLGVMTATSSAPSASSRTVEVVAGENFWGSLVSQLGGAHVHVTTIVSDPNADPHDYESTSSTARDFARADYVVLNGAGYDSWGQKLLDASPQPNRVNLDVANLIAKKDGDNPHFWYNPAYVNTVLAHMSKDLAHVDPADASYFQAQLKKVQTLLAPYQDRIADIKHDYAGTKVAATEDIFQYLADSAGLDLISPQTFTEAVAEGNDPPTQSVAEFQQQLQNKEPAVLVYNQQTATPLTTNVKKIATANNIPVIGITETVSPANATFQDWMNAEVTALQQALSQTRGQ